MRSTLARRGPIPLIARLASTLRALGAADAACAAAPFFSAPSSSVTELTRSCTPYFLLRTHRPLTSSCWPRDNVSRPTPGSAVIVTSAPTPAMPVVCGPPEQRSLATVKPSSARWSMSVRIPRVGWASTAVGVPPLDVEGSFLGGCWSLLLCEGAADNNCGTYLIEDSPCRAVFKLADSIDARSRRWKGVWERNIVNAATSTRLSGSMVDS